MYCSKCGTQFNKDSKFCRKCGQPVNNEGQITVADTINDAHKEKSRHRKFEWFDKSIKDEASLSLEDVEYLKRYSFSTYVPFYNFARENWDMCILKTLITFFPVFDNLLGPNKAFLGIIMIVLYIYIGSNTRRLSWNRTNWKSFAEFKKNEETNNYWGKFLFALTILYLFAILNGYKPN